LRRRLKKQTGKNESVKITPSEKIRSPQEENQPQGKDRGNSTRKIDSDLKTTPPKKTDSTIRVSTRFSLQTQIKSIHPNHGGHRPPSLISLLEMKSRKWHTNPTLGIAEMKLGSGKLPPPSRVPFIGPSKMLKDDYAPGA
jgi:hypothetical protein